MRLRHKGLVVFTVGLDVVRNSYVQDDAIPRVFMGFGYNPDLQEYGERLDMLNFFSWMKNLQRKNGFECIIWDASGYWIVNKTPKKKIEKFKGQLSAKNILEVLIEEQESPKRSEIKLNCDLRSLYLRRLIGISKLKATYIDSRAIFRDDPLYAEALDLSFDFVERLKIDNPILINKIIPPSDNPSRELYLPLEIAEALYLRCNINVGAKFGPLTEEYFDACILRLFEELRTPYLALRCSIGPRSPGYLSGQDVVRTSSSDLDISRLLRNDEMYKSFVEQYLNPFREPEESLLDCTMRMRNSLKLGGDAL